MENYKLISEIKNDLFNRTEIKFTIEAKINPNHDEVEKFISKQFKTNPENIKIKGIHGKFGANVFTIETNIYTSAEEKEATEKKKKWEIERAKKAKEEAEKPADAPVEEAPKEEVKQEVKEETKPKEIKPIEEAKA